MSKNEIFFFVVAQVSVVPFTLNAALLVCDLSTIVIVFSFLPDLSFSVASFLFFLCVQRKIFFSLYLSLGRRSGALVERLSQREKQHSHSEHNGKQQHRQYQRLANIETSRR